MKYSRRRIAALVVLALGAATFVTVAVVLLRGIPFPGPTGPYAVGRTSYHLVDESRPEIFTEEPNDCRELMITVHYPAEKNARESRAPYADGPLAAGISEVYDTPRFVNGLMYSHALEKPPCRKQEGGFPVVIFSPGFGTPTLFYTATLEDLASHGFIVASVYHPYSLGVTAFPDGRIVRQNDVASNTDATLLGGGETQDPESTDSDVGSVWVKDVRFVLDQLTRMNRDDKLLGGRMNLARVGVFGHSFGGATSLRTMQLDDRFLAGINMDGADFYATAAEGRVQQPFLWLNASEHEVTDADLERAGKTRAWAEQTTRTFDQRVAELLKQSPKGSRATLRGATHATFTSDLTLLADTWPWSVLVAGVDRGTIAGRRAVLVQNACIVDFFQRNLGEPPMPSAKKVPHEFAELEWKTRQP